MGQVLDVIDESPRLLRVGVAFVAPTREDAKRGDEIVPHTHARPDFLEQRCRKRPLRQRVQGLGIVGAPYDAQGVDDVGDDVVVHERLAACQPARHALAQELSFQQQAVSVVAIQHRGISPAGAAGGPILEDVANQPIGFRVLVGKASGLDVERRIAVGLDAFGEAGRIVRDQLSRSLEDLNGAAPILIQKDGLRHPELIAEPSQDRGIRAGPGEDRLLVVSHAEEVAVVGDEHLEQLVLGEVEILELVHQHVVPPGSQRPRHRLLHTKQLLREIDHAVEVHQVTLPEQPHVLAKELLVAGGELIALQAVTAEVGEELPMALLANPKSTEQPALKILVGHAEAGAEAGLRGKLAKYRKAECVNGPAGELTLGQGDRAFETRRDLLCRLVGEGHGADAGRSEPEDLDEVLDAPDQAIRLAGPGPSDYEYRPQRRLDSPPLLRSRSLGHAAPAGRSARAQPTIVSASSPMTSSGARPDRLSTSNEWSPPSTRWSVARGPSPWHTWVMRSTGAKGSRVPWRKSIGTFTWRRWSARRVPGCPGG